MKTKLVRVKEIIENEIGERIDTKNRKRHLTYARAVYSKIGRDMGIPYEQIGAAIDRDHATVMHSVKKIFDLAMQDDEYRKMYNTLTSLMIDNESKPEIVPSSRHFKLIKSISDKLRVMRQENSSLRRRIKEIERGKDDFGHLFRDLDENELQVVYEKTRLFVKAIKSGVHL